MGMTDKIERKAYYQDVEVADALPEFDEQLSLESMTATMGVNLEFEDVICEAYRLWEQYPRNIACSYTGEIFWFITEDGHMYDRDNKGFYLEGFFVGSKEIHIDPFGYYEMW